VVLLTEFDASLSLVIFVFNDMLGLDYEFFEGCGDSLLFWDTTEIGNFK